MLGSPQGSCGKKSSKRINDYAWILAHTTWCVFSLFVPQYHVNSGIIQKKRELISCPFFIFAFLIKFVRVYTSDFFFLFLVILATFLVVLRKTYGTKFVARSSFIYWIWVQSFVACSSFIYWIWLTYGRRTAAPIRKGK